MEGEIQLIRGIVDSLKVMVGQICAHGYVLAAILNTLDAASLKRIKDILQLLSESPEFQGEAAETLRVAIEFVSSATNSEAPLDPRGLFRLIPGGKSG